MRTIYMLFILTFKILMGSVKNQRVSTYSDSPTVSWKLGLKCITCSSAHEIIQSPLSALLVVPISLLAMFFWTVRSYHHSFLKEGEGEGSEMAVVIGKGCFTHAV